MDARRSAGATPAGALRVDLRTWCSPIEHQGDIGSCTAHAVVGALEYFERKTRGVHVDASRLFLYRTTRRFLGWEDHDSGAFLRSTIKALKIFGAPPERYMPYDERDWNREPEAFLYAYAQSFRALEYFRVEPTVDHLKSSLDAGMPFVFGFTCFSSLDDDEVARTGVIPYPKRSERQTGGHAVMAVGYTDSHVLVRNSWGKGWGIGGYGLLPWQYFDATAPLADDCWGLLNAEFLPDDEADQDVELPPASVGLAATGRRSAAKAIDALVSTPSARVRAGTVREEGEQSYVTITSGRDPLQSIPLRFSSRGLRASEPAEPTQLPRSAAPARLLLEKLTLNESFDWGLFRKPVNELYLVAVTWDLSGAAPHVFPPKTIEELTSGTYRMKKGGTLTFVGEGIELYPPEFVVGGLYVRIHVLESDEDVRKLGRKITSVHQAVQQSGLPAALGSITAGLASAGTLTAVASAAWALTGVIGKLLAEDGDDHVALFDGTFGIDALASGMKQHVDQLGASIDLALKTGTAPAPTKAATSGAKKVAATKRLTRRK